MKKLLSILAAVGMTATAGIAVVACSDKGGTQDEKLNIKINGIDKNKIDMSINSELEKEITNTKDLKNLKVSLTVDDKYKDAISVELKKVEPYEDSNPRNAQLVIESKTATEKFSATIKLTADNANELSITLNVNLDVAPVPKSLQDLPDIKIIEGEKGKDIKPKIVDAIKNYQPEAKETTDYTISDIPETVNAGDTITISSVEDSLLTETKTLTVDAKTPEVPNLDTIIKVTDLGKDLLNNEPQTIIDRVVELNTGVTADLIDVKEGSITDTGATIIPTTDEYTGTVNVTFTIKDTTNDQEKFIEQINQLSQQSKLHFELKVKNGEEDQVNGVTFANAIIGQLKEILKDNNMPIGFNNLSIESAEMPPKDIIKNGGTWTSSPNQTIGFRLKSDEKFFNVVCNYSFTITKYDFDKGIEMLNDPTVWNAQGGTDIRLIKNFTNLEDVKVTLDTGTDTNVLKYIQFGYNKDTGRVTITADKGDNVGFVEYHNLTVIISAKDTANISFKIIINPETRFNLKDLDLNNITVSDGEYFWASLIEWQLNELGIANAIWGIDFDMVMEYATTDVLHIYALENSDKLVGSFELEGSYEPEVDKEEITIGVNETAYMNILNYKNLKNISFGYIDTELTINYESNDGQFRVNAGNKPGDYSFFVQADNSYVHQVKVHIVETAKSKLSDMIDKFVNSADVPTSDKFYEVMIAKGILNNSKSNDFSYEIATLRLETHLDKYDDLTAGIEKGLAYWLSYATENMQEAMGNKVDQSKLDTFKTRIEDYLKVYNDGQKDANQDFTKIVQAFVKDNGLDPE